MDAIQRFTENVVNTTYADLPASTVAATKTFLLDTLGVCIAGSTGAGVRELLAPYGIGVARPRAACLSLGTNYRRPGPPWPIAS